MNFDLSPDQLTLQRSLEQIAMRHAIEPSATYYASAPELEKELSDGGFFDIAHQEDMGSPEALLLVETIAALSVCIEVGTSALVAPHAARFGAPLPRPVAIFETSARAPVRFLPGAATALAISDDGVRIIDVARCSFETVQTPFGYPFGRLIDFDPLKWPIAEGVAPSIMRQWWRVALAGEIAAAADSAVALTVEHVSLRRQFGRPLGSFQAIQHRLAECATLVHGARLLARRAASSGSPVDAALAALYAQQACAQTLYDTHQFHGAMGVTLECALHSWTYRLRALQGELGGWSAQAEAAADAIWGA